jgi:hypothetical protein
MATQLTSPKPKRDRSGLVLFVVLFGGIFVIVALSKFNDARFPPKPEPSPTVASPVVKPAPDPDRGSHLRGLVTTEGLTMVITNDEAADWSDITLHMNGRYSTQLSFLASKATARVNIREFVLPDGTRFNPFSVKPLDFDLVAHRSNGTDGALALRSHR